MRIFITLPNKKRGGFLRYAEKPAAVFAWFGIWQLASMIVKQEMLLASPASVIRRLFELAGTFSFWKTVLFSLTRVGIGFSLALAAGIALAAVAYRARLAEVFLRPFMEASKAAPVVSYIILCLLFLPSRSLSVCISFLMGLPIIYTNILEGLKSTDKSLLEMAQVFNVTPLRKVVYIYFSHLMPFLVSACGVALGLCWKSGIAAEVIGLPLGSIGENMYQAKIYVDTKSLFAWTAVVIIVSFALERALIAALKRLMSAVERR